MTSTENTAPINSILNFPEVHRNRRGHVFYAPELAKLPDLYVTEEVEAENKMILAHFFIGGSDWWIAELDKSDGMMFGYVRMNADNENAEWGYSDLVALESLQLSNGMVIERDLHWTPKKFSDIEMGF